MSRASLAGAARLRRVVSLLAFTVAVTSRASAQAGDTERPWWVGMDLGYGQLQLASDQLTGAHQGTFAMAFRGGRALGPRLRVGLELGGWLLEAFDPSDPWEGESVSNLLLVAHLFPFRRAPVFFQLGAGPAWYTNNRPAAFSSSGWGWSAGVGCQARLSRGFSIVPEVNYAAGEFEDLRPVLGQRTNLHHSVWDARVGVMWHLGRDTP